LLEARRWRALRLLDQGRSLNEVGRAIGCAPSSVMRWRDARRRGGAAALKVRISPGRPPKLNDAQQRRLGRMLMRKTEDGARWTSAVVARLIRSTFGVSFHPDHAGRLMRRLTGVRLRRSRSGGRWQHPGSGGSGRPARRMVGRRSHLRSSRKPNRS